jgi:pimeloyl-ACP methyl ester carboxylesterase
MTQRSWRRFGAAVGVVVVVVAALLWTPDRSREALEQTYLAADTDLRSIDGVWLHVRDTGPRDAPVLVLLHGFGSSLHTWEPWARELEREFRVIRFDLPGSGLSAPDTTGDYRDPRSHHVLTALLDSLRVPRATLIGNSLGGRIAWSFGAANPARVERLVLIAPDGFASPGFEYDKPPQVPASLGIMRYVLPKWLLRMSLAPAYADPARLSDEAVTRYHDLLLAPGGRAAMLQRMQQSVLTDPVPRLQQIDVPVLLVWGDKDAMIPVHNADDYLRALPNARVVRFPTLGHVPFEEDPTTSLPPVLAFLRER